MNTTLSTAITTLLGAAALGGWAPQSNHDLDADLAMVSVSKPCANGRGEWLVQLLVGQDPSGAPRIGWARTWCNEEARGRTAHREDLTLAQASSLLSGFPVVSG